MTHDFDLPWLWDFQVVLKLKDFDWSKLTFDQLQIKTERTIVLKRSESSTLEQNCFSNAFLFVFCASYLLYVYSNIISVDNIIITNNKMIQFSVHQGSCQHIFSQGFWCTFVYSWNGSYRNSLGLLLTQTKYITTLFRKKERQMQCPS